MSASEQFDKEIIAQINKKQAVEAMAGIYNHLPPALIEQMYDFCNDPRYTELNQYIYYKNEYDNLSANELKKFYKLDNKFKRLFKDLPEHRRYAKDEVIEGAIVAGNVEASPNINSNIVFEKHPERQSKEDARFINGNVSKPTEETQLKNNLI